MSFISVVGRKRLERVAEWLEAGAPHVRLDDHGVMREFKGFDMSTTATCGSACCIAGAICQFERPYSLEDFAAHGSHRAGGMEFFDDYPEFQGVMPRAIELLGISNRDAYKLFVPTGLDADLDMGGMELDALTDPAEGARVIRHYLETGEVIWDAIAREREE
jgi:hypothetical protein